MKTFYEKNQNQFAAYFNMARQNLYMVMQRISQIIGVDTAAIKENHLSDIIKKWQNRWIILRNSLPCSLKCW